MAVFDEAWAQIFAQEVKTYFKREAENLRAEIRAEVEERIRAVETRTLRYVGTHTEGRQYVPGEMVSHGGSLWHAETSTVSRPGSDSSWRLCLKRGEFSK